MGFARGKPRVASFTSHDLAVIRSIADEILVMKDGRIVERGLTADIFERSAHDYSAP